MHQMAAFTGPANEITAAEDLHTVDVFSKPFSDSFNSRLLRLTGIQERHATKGT